jgi:probable F420-dependent oxidoreductase
METISTRATTGTFVGVRPAGWFGADASTAPERVIDWAVEAEQVGFDAVFVGDRLLSEGGSADRVVYAASMLDPWVVLAAIAARTSRIGLAPLVAVIPFRHPAYLAKVTASLDIVSRGRFILGAGAGWSDPELRMFGVDRRTRGQRMEEGIDLVRQLWTGDAVSAKGRFWELDGVRVLPRPIQRPGPPVWLGTFSPDDETFWGGEMTQAQRRVLRRTGRIANAWVPLTYSAAFKVQISAQMMAEGWNEVAAGAEAAGRTAPDVEVVYAHWLAIVRTEAERRACEEALSRFFTGTYEEARQTYLIGTPEEIVETIAEQTALLDRIDGFLFTPIGDRADHLHAIAEDLRPLLAQLPGAQR